eukprot:11189020-Lingulodinium_polyedra.AAC.1
MLLGCRLRTAWVLLGCCLGAACVLLGPPTARRRKSRARALQINRSPPRRLANCTLAHSTRAPENWRAM